MRKLSFFLFLTSAPSFSSFLVDGIFVYLLSKWLLSHFIHCHYFSFAAGIFLFYLIFYAALAAFFLIYWYIFATTLVDGRPKYELKESIIGTNPGLGFRPMPPESNVESTLIWYEKNNPENSKYWIEELEHFLESKEENEIK